MSEITGAVRRHQNAIRQPSFKESIEMIDQIPEQSAEEEKKSDVERKSDGSQDETIMQLLALPKEEAV